MTRILVTGATGTVGRHVTSGLTETDAEVRAGVRSGPRAGARRTRRHVIAADECRVRATGRT